MNMDNQRKESTWRKKIEIKKLDKQANKQVTFSKRRQGLFRKASELCVLCDVHAIIVFSSADKLYCFGQPNTDTIINSYVRGITEFEDLNDQLEQFMVSIYELRRKQIERDDEQHAMMLNM
ncbi:hypothetical protein P8452_39233 [Trifolium repens]|nr:hypothetical protein P8452_39233 [Trifolium repens]